MQYPSNNLPPSFGSASSTKRFVPENAAEGNDVGEPVTAVDPNGADDLLAGGYSLSGADQNSFSINSGTGQLITRMKFNQEQKEKYTVTVTAMDAHGATASIRVDIYVIDVDEMRRRSWRAAWHIQYKGQQRQLHAENGTDAVDTYTAVGPDADMARWSLEGDDDSHFTISRGGELTFRNTPNYEMPRSDDGDNTYMVTVVAEDTMDNMASKDVTVTVTNVVELGMLTADMDSSISYMENGTMPVATYMADGPMADNVPCGRSWATDAATTSTSRAVCSSSRAPPTTRCPRPWAMTTTTPTPTWSPSRPRPAAKWR